MRLLAVGRRLVPSARREAGTSVWPEGDVPVVPLVNTEGLLLGGVVAGGFVTGVDGGVVIGLDGGPVGGRVGGRVGSLPPHAPVGGAAGSGAPGSGAPGTAGAAGTAVRGGIGPAGRPTGVWPRRSAILPHTVQ